MNLLFFCFSFLALQVLLIEGPQKRAKGRGTGTAVGRPTGRRTSTKDSQSPSAQQRTPSQKSIYGKSFRKEIIAYLTEDNDPINFGARDLRNERRGWANNRGASNFQPQPDWKYSPEVYWALQDLEAFASLKVTYKGQKDSKYYYPPSYFGYTDTTFQRVPGIHQVTAMLSTRDQLYVQICCSVFVKILRKDKTGISKAFCGHPVCYDSTLGMTYWNDKDKLTCRPPPISKQPSANWTRRPCNKLIISKNNN